MNRITAVLAALLLVIVTGCERADLISSPDEGAIVAGEVVTVTGVLPDDLPLGGTLSVNGEEGVVAADRTWSVSVPHAETGYVTPLEVIYEAPNGQEYRQRRAVVRGDSFAVGEHAPDAVGMHITNDGLDGLGPVIQDLSAGAFDIGGLLADQNPIFDEPNAFLHFHVRGDVYEAGLGSVTIDPVSTADGIVTEITIEDLYVGLDLNIRDGLLIDLDCGLELEIPTTTINATFDFQPLAGDESKVDVTLIGEPQVATAAVDYEFISGVCDSGTFIIGDIVNALAGPQVEAMVGDGFATSLGNPDSPLADAIQTALADISIAGAVGEALQAHLDAPFTSITTTDDGIDFRADAAFFATPGATPSDCVAPDGAPDLASTFATPGTYPDLGATTPDGDPYGLGLVISTSAFNQLLGAMTECGVLNQEVTEFPAGDSTLPITAGLLALLIPAFGDLPADTPMFVRVTPTVAPFLTESEGPNGEVSELVLANLRLEFVQPGEDHDDLVWLDLAVDAPLGFSLDYDAEVGGLEPTITAPSPEVISARVVRNRIGADEPAVEELFPNLFPTFVGAVGDSFAGFPLPGFLGVNLDVLDVVRDGNYYVLYAALEPVQVTRIENVTIADLSSANSATDSIFDVHEWRNRIRPTIGSTQVDIRYGGMLGANACCTTGDVTRSAHAGFELTFDVVPEDGDTWQVDLSHMILGAHTLVDEKVLLEDAGGETRFTTPITARARVGDGAWQSFDAAVSPTEVVHVNYGGEGDSNVEFTGGNSMTLTGATAETITLEIGFDMFVKSDSNLFFPAAGGDQVAIRFGVNDTITNGFTAGGYPGLGNRDITEDGHFTTIGLTVVDP